MKTNIPETFAEKFYSDYHGFYVCFAEHAEDLERERDEAIRSCHIWQQGHSDLVADRDGWKKLHIETNGLFPDLTIREQERDIGLLDKDNLAPRVKWVNALRAIVGATMPKNKSGMSLVSDIDLILASDEQRLAALEKIK